MLQGRQERSQGRSWPVQTRGDEPDVGERGAAAGGARSSGSRPRHPSSQTGSADARRNDKSPGLPGLRGGRYQTRTDDLFRVKEARYQLRQSPAEYILPHPEGLSGPLRNPFATPRRARFGIVCRRGLQSSSTRKRATRMWRSGSASPCQGEGREFESRHPLEWESLQVRAHHGGVAERRGSGLQSRIRGFKSRLHLSQLNTWAIGAAVARFPDTEEVTGSNPVSPTQNPGLDRGFSLPSAARATRADVPRPAGTAGENQDRQAFDRSGALTARTGTSAPATSPASTPDSASASAESRALRCGHETRHDRAEVAAAG